MRKDTNKKIDIYGSCVSRDVFEVPKADKLDCQEYIARQSLFSLFAKPLPIEESDISGITSNFQKRLLINDFYKTTFEKLKASQGEYLLVDFIDERFKIVEIGEASGVFLTQSNELTASKYLENREYRLIDKKQWDEAKFCDEVKPKVVQFASEISKLYKKGHIIIHKARMVDSYIGKDGEVHAFADYYLQDNKRVNAMLDNMYGWLEESLKEPYVIDVSAKYMADENHKWGLSTMHYQLEYYQEVAEKISEVVYENKILKRIKYLYHRIIFKR